MKTYNVRYALTGGTVQYTPQDKKTKLGSREYSVQAYDVGNQVAYYIRRADLARILRDARNLAHLKVVVYRNTR